MKLNKKVASWLVTGTWVVGFVVMGADVWGSKETVENLVGASGVMLGVLALVIVVGLRWNGVKSPRIVVGFKGVVSSLMMAVGLGLGIWEYLTADNYVYAMTRINPELMVQAAHVGWAMMLVMMSEEWFRKNGSRLLIMMPLWLLMINAWTHLLPFDGTVLFTIEDGPVENVQVMLVMTAAGVAFSEAYRGWKKKRKKQWGVWLVVMMALIFVSMEEISWGQRILGIETPEALKAVNVQDETNIHNIGIMNLLQWVGYIVLSGVGVLVPWMVRWGVISKARWQPLWIVSWWMVLPLVFYVSTFVGVRHFIHAEVVEVLFYGGLTWWVWGCAKETRELLKRKFKEEK